MTNRIHGALVKNAESLERMGRVDVVIFDKTGITANTAAFITYVMILFFPFNLGTLTSGSISVVDILDVSNTGKMK